MTSLTLNLFRMKCFLTLLLSFCLNGLLQAQKLPDLSSISLAKESDFNAAANDAALKVATYLLSQPIDADVSSRKEAGAFLVKWMEGTPDYSFQLEPSVMALTDQNPEILSVVFAGMVEYVLNNPQKKDEVAATTIASVKKLIAYASDPAHHLTGNKSLQGAAAADKKGKLRGYLDSINAAADEKK